MKVSDVLAVEKDVVYVPIQKLKVVFQCLLPVVNSLGVITSPCRTPCYSWIAQSWIRTDVVAFSYKLFKI